MLMTKAILSSISSGILFWSVNYTSVYKNFELNIFENINFVIEISNNWHQIICLEQMYTNLVNLVDNSS